jgi:hypothetical protein
LLDIWQLNNVEFKQGIVLREALRTMRNSPASYKQAVPFRETYGSVYIYGAFYLPDLFYTNCPEMRAAPGEITQQIALTNYL